MRTQFNVVQHIKLVKVIIYFKDNRMILFFQNCSNIFNIQIHS
jgi:hypothetical protein